MNRTKYKKLKNKVKKIQVQWLRTLLPEDNGEPITVQDVSELMPDQTHIFGDGQFKLSYMSEKWVIKFLKKYPHINNYNEIEEIINGAK